MKKLTFIALTGLFLLGSCTMEKRHFLPGYYTDFKNRDKNKDIATVQHDQVVNSETGSLNSDRNPNAKTENPVSMINPEKTIPQIVMAKSVDRKGNVSGIRETPLAQKTTIPAINKVFPVKEVKNDPVSADGNDFPIWAYVLIALILPPLAVGLKYGCHGAFWLCLLFTLIGFVPGLIYALVYMLLTEK